MLPIFTLIPLNEKVAGNVPATFREYLKEGALCSHIRLKECFVPLSLRVFVVSLPTDRTDRTCV